MFCTIYAQNSVLQAYWDDGLKFQSKDSLYRFSVGGRVHYDVAFSGQTETLDTTFKNPASKVEVRRARLSFEGSINKALAYEFEFTFGETIEYADMYFAFLRLPYFDRLTVGHFREPFGMEELTSSNAIVFMERSLTSAFGPSRNTGIMLQKQFMNERLKGYAGIFRITDDLGSDLLGQGNHSFSTRWAYTPIADDRNTLHLGLSFNRFAPNNNIYQIKTNNEVHTSPDFISTDKLTAVKNVNQIGAEAGFLTGPLLIQSEWVQTFARQAIEDEQSRLAIRQFKGGYLMASYFLKGGVRGYSKNGNRFSSIKLTDRYEQGSMSGAWEAALRFSFIDVSQAVQPLHTLSNITAGLNWYFNSNSRVMMNYVYSFFNNGFRANTLQFRIQVTF